MLLVQEDIAAQKRWHLETGSCKLKLKQVFPDYTTNDLVENWLPIKIGY